jgi:hypothetical protein
MDHTLVLKKMAADKDIFPVRRPCFTCYVGSFAHRNIGQIVQGFSLE